MTDGSEEIQVDAIVRSLVRRAEAAEKAGDNNHAVALLIEAALTDPGKMGIGSSLFGIAQAYSDQHNYKAALSVYNLIRALFEHEDVAEYDIVLFNSGVALVELGDLEQGEVLLREAVENDPEASWRLRPFGYFLLNQQEYEEGIAFLKAANEIDYFEYNQENLESLEAIAWAEFKQGRKEEALQFLLENVANFLDYRVLDIYLRLVRLMDDQAAVDAIKQMEEKLSEYEAEELPIGDPEPVLIDAWLELATRYQKLGKKDKALNYFLEAWNNKSLASLIGRGKAFLEFGEVDLTLKYADQAAALAPENPLPQTLRARAYLAKEDYPAALQAADDGLSLALKSLPKTIQEEPGQYLFEEFTAPSLKLMEQTQRESEGDPRPELFLAKVDALTGLERYEEALQTLNQAMLQFPTKIIFFRYAAALLLKMGKPEEARAQFDAARKAKAKLDAPSKKLIKKIKAALTQ